MQKAVIGAWIVGPVLMSGSLANASVYIALGDSITFGETDLTYTQSNGDRGYVGLYANYLATLHGGVRPTVVNLAIDGETASSFMTGIGRVPPVTGRTDPALAEENTNYNAASLVTQDANFVQTLATEKAAGQTVSTVSITLGFNDLSTAAGQPQSTIPGILASYQFQYGTILNEIHTDLPNAKLLVLGYYNPFPADPGSPAAPIFNTYGTELNGIIQTLAAEYGGTYVNTAPPFIGKETSLTYLAAYPSGSTSPGAIYVGTEPIGNVHPDAMGYASIEGQVAGASVPEPVSVGALAFATLSLLGRRRTRVRIF